MKKIAIIGGGLSGLYAAALLEKEYDVTLFEARERLGGRIYTIDGFDLGPSWIWPHQRRILKLINSLGLQIISQYSKGYALYETPHKIERFAPPPSAPSGRIQGGIDRLIEALVSKITQSKIVLNEPVESLRLDGDSVLVFTQSGKYHFDEVIVTLPPRLLLESLLFDPPLPPQTFKALESIPTWMGHSAKCVIEFETPFWREMGLSGFCFSHAGPMGEIHDACIDGRYALFGFINAHADMTTIEEDVRHQCRVLFGDAGERILNFYCVDWRNEKYTSVKCDENPPRSHPNYGFHASHLDGKIHCIGTESSFEEGGYLEGAIASAETLCTGMITLSQL